MNNRFDTTNKYTNLDFGLGKIQKFFEDDGVEEIMVNGKTHVFVKYRDNDQITKTNVKFASIDDVYEIIEKLLKDTGRKVDMGNPIVDLRLSNGDRTNIVLPPISIYGPAITIRKFPKRSLSLKDLLKLETLDKKTCEFLLKAVSDKANIIIAGATSSGKTTTLGALCQEFPIDERIIVIEETSEINLSDKLENVVNLETRPKNFDGKNGISLRDLVRNALRMRPDRIIVGEVRGLEAFDLLQALNTGHKGSISTLHANSCQDALYRLEAMVMLANFSGLNSEIVRKWIVNGIDLIIFQEKDKNGKRVISEIAKVKDDFTVEPI